MNEKHVHGWDGTPVGLAARGGDERELFRAQFEVYEIDKILGLFKQATDEIATIEDTLSRCADTLPTEEIARLRASVDVHTRALARLQAQLNEHLSRAPGESDDETERALQ